MTIVDLHTQRVMEVWHERKRYIFPLSVLQHTTERTVLWRNWWFSCMVVDNE